MSDETWTGGCLCGAVRYAVSGPLRDVIACHCHECRRASSHYVTASAAQRKDLTITKSDGLGWYVHSVIRRGFCQRCGSTLFFDHGPDYPTGIATGSLDDAAGLRLAVHIYIDEAGRYYEIADDGAPQMDSRAWSETGWDSLRWVEKGSGARDPGDGGSAQKPSLNRLRTSKTRSGSCWA